MKAIPYAVFVLLVASLNDLFAGPSLSRSEAKEKLELSPDVVALHHALPTLSQEELNRGAQEGLWTVQYRNQMAGLTTKGMELFFTETDTIFHVPQVKVRQPIDVTIDVTGITDVPLTGNIKHVEFNWTNRAGGIVTQFLREGGTGSADFQLYDDGWRVSRVNTRHSDARMALTSQDQEAIRQALADASSNGSSMPPPDIRSANPYFTTTQDLNARGYPIAQWSNIPGVVISPYPPHNLIRVDNVPPGALTMDPTVQRIFRRP